MDVTTANLLTLMLKQLPGLAGAIQAAAAPASGLTTIAGAQRNQNIINALLNAVSGLLATNPTGYSIGPLQRLSPRVGTVLGGYDDGAAQAQLLGALGMGGRGAQSRGSAPAAQPPVGHPPQAQERSRPTSGLTAVAEQTPCDSVQYVAQQVTATTHQSESPVRKLREFNGTLSSRLCHPAVLPGGWRLYGYARGTGDPVYIGPGNELRVYA